jgi:hypothetical protein
LHLPDNLGNAHIPLTSEYKDVSAVFQTTLQIDKYVAMNQAFLSNERAGNCQYTVKRHVYGPFYCPKLVHAQFVMLPNCDAVLCCMDFGIKHTLGNLLSETFTEIANGKLYRAISRNRFSWTGDTLCRQCRNASHPLKYFARATFLRIQEKYGIA